jgi:hypothetical protein
MKYELRKVRVHPDMSQETECFSAEIWTSEGVKVARVSNDGLGGCNSYDAFGDYRSSAELKAFEAWCKAQPSRLFYGITLPSNPDMCVFSMLKEWAEQKWLKRQCRTRTLYRVKGDPDGEWRTLNLPWEDHFKTFLETKYGDSLESIANLTLCKEKA